MAFLIAKGTGRGLKNRGVASDLIGREAINGWISPNSLEKSI